MRSKAPILVILKRAGALLLAAASACALSVVSFAASDTPSDGVAVSVTVDSDSGITPVGEFTGIHGIDNKSYILSPQSKQWVSDWQYRWSNWTSGASGYGFKNFTSIITIPVNASVPRSSNTTLFVPFFYILPGFTVKQSNISRARITFFNKDNNVIKLLDLNATVDASNIILIDDTSVELGEGSWIVKDIELRFSFDNVVLINSSTDYFALSGFQFSMTTSLSVSEFISQQTQDIIKNDVLPAVENMNQSINDVNSSVEEVNQSVQAVEQAVKQGNKEIQDFTNAFNESQNVTHGKLDSLDTKLEELPNKIGDEFDASLESAADKEKEEATSTGNKYINDLLESVDIDSASWLTAFNRLTDVLTSTSTECTITFPALSLPALTLSGESFSGSSLTEEQEVDLTYYFNKYIPPIIFGIIRSLMTAAISLFLFHEVSDFVLFCLGVGNNNE